MNVAVEILQCTTEFAGMHKSGQDSTFAEVNELIALLTQHEEDLLKHLMDLNWKTGREPWPFEAPSKVSRPPPCGSTSSSANRTRRTDLHLRVCANCA